MSGTFLESLDLVTREEKQETALELKPPRRYKVLLVNDDYTPMDFVIDVLMRFFGYSEVVATELMLQVHYKGSTTCGIYTRDIAETKVHQVVEFAQQHEYPLMCSMEPE